MRLDETRRPYSLHACAGCAAAPRRFPICPDDSRDARLHRPSRTRRLCRHHACPRRQRDRLPRRSPLMRRDEPRSCKTTRISAPIRWRNRIRQVMDPITAGVTARSRGAGRWDAAGRLRRAREEGALGQEERNHHWSGRMRYRHPSAFFICFFVGFFVDLPRPRPYTRHHYSPLSLDRRRAAPSTEGRAT